MEIGINAALDPATIDLQERLMRPFGTWRIMDWQRITVSNWEKAAFVPTKMADLPISAELWRYRGGPWAAWHGVPLEWAAEAANDAKARLWVCIPHRFSRHEMAKFMLHVAQYAKHGVIFEYSNEVWNNGFLAHHDCTAFGKRWNMATDWTAALHWAAEQTLAMARIAKGLGDSDVSVVLSGQCSNEWVIDQMLPRCAHVIDAIAIAPYFGHRPNGSPPPALSEMSAEIEVLADKVAKHRAIADRYELQLWCYEGGQHVMGARLLTSETNKSNS